uniref:Acetylcholinesterase n=1 Tax=Parastrongyloides trichosuri TaxID=131310 RepID=A0A0N5A6R4_PARTI
MLIYSLVILLPLVFGYTYKEKKIQTKHGTLSGTSFIFNTQRVTQYLGVPYAKAPTGEFRFKPPRPLDKPEWDGVYHATKVANTCPQKIKTTGFYNLDSQVPENEVSEDCLQLNMWVPNPTNAHVMVFFFGGQYNFGSPSTRALNGSILARKTGTIVIHVNYRVGIFGFGYLGNGTQIPGNMGLLDQQLALKWISENIRYFGGSPIRVTIWGHDAGAASATAHMFAPGSVRYFKRMILLSGTIRNPWASISNKYAEQNTLDVAKKLKCKGKADKILECLQKAPVNKLIEYSLQVRQKDQEPVFYSFAPVKSDNLFFKGSLTYKLRTKKFKKDADIWIGKGINEATLFMPQLLYDEPYNCKFNPKLDGEDKKNQCILKKEHFKQVVLKFIGKKLIKGDYERIEEEYNKLNITEPRDRVAAFLSDYLFECDIIRFTDDYISKSSKYTYFYHYERQSLLNKFPKWMGIFHGIELEQTFSLPLLFPKIYGTRGRFIRERKYSHKISKMMGYFAKKGVPGCLWRKYKKGKEYGGIYENNLTLVGPKRSRAVPKRTCKVLQSILG